MAMIENIVSQLIIDEGLILHPYKDTKGLITIGVGRCLDTNPLYKYEIDYLMLNNEREKYIDVEGLSSKEANVKLLAHFTRFGISKEEALWLCVQDVNRCIKSLSHNLSWFDTANETVKEVLVNMCYNMGINGLLTFKNSLKLLEGGYYTEAATEMLKSKWRKDVGERAERLCYKLKTLNEYA